MSETPQPAPPPAPAGRAAGYYRIDTFTVPAAGRAEFLGRVAATHRVLEAQPGFVRGVVLERPAGSDAPGGVLDGATTVVTVVEWASEAVAAPVAAAVAAAHRAAGFDPGEMLARLGIHADLAAYHPLAP